MLTGGHPNSLGRTIEVVDAILADTRRMQELFDCYKSKDEVVRLRTSNAMRRVQAERPDLIGLYIDRLIEEIGALDQASAQWTLAKLFQSGMAGMNDQQRAAAVEIVKRNLAEHSDWIVLKNSMQALTEWAINDANLGNWMKPHLKRLSQDRRKAVARQAEKSLQTLGRN